MDDPDDVVEVMASDCRSSSSSKKRKRTTKVAPKDIIEIDEDDDPAGFMIIGEKVSTVNKGEDTLAGYNKNWANQIKDALTQDFLTPASAPEFGLIKDIPLNPLKSSGIGSNYLNNLNGGSLNYGFNNLSYSYNNALYYDGTMGLQAPFAADLSLGLGNPFPWFEQPTEIHSKPVTSSSSSVPNLLSSSWYNDKEEEFWLQLPAQRQKKPASTNSATFPCQPTYAREKEEDEDEVMKNYRSFKRFDTVGDYSDHHYANKSSSSKQPPRNWAKVIQNQWKILEKDLPDTIFVRVYEERMDLLRAVIVGAAGTPYHDGLFFFDICFSSSYPSVPPSVHYHSGGLRLNPNLYNCGKVCLSLLNTWHGNAEEQWIPGKSTMLQVLLSIQALVLNAKPYFNEPGYAHMAGGNQGEKLAHTYNENTFILSCRTMLFKLKKPPRHFENFVMGHFRERAHAILVACKAYMDGAQVGCLAGGGVQDVDEGDKSGSQNFKTQVGLMVKNLVAVFTQNGSNDCKQFLSQINNDRKMASDTRRRSYGARSTRVK